MQTLPTTPPALTIPDGATLVPPRRCAACGLSHSVYADCVADEDLQPQDPAALLRITVRHVLYGEDQLGLGGVVGLHPAMASRMLALVGRSINIITDAR